MVNFATLLLVELSELILSGRECGSDTALASQPSTRGWELPSLLGSFLHIKSREFVLFQILLELGVIG